jgi:hypothetical protein
VYINAPGDASNPSSHGDRAAVARRPGSYTGASVSDRETLEDLSQSPELQSTNDGKSLILKTERCQSGRLSTLGKRSGRATPDHADAVQRTRDQRLNASELLHRVRP